MSRIQIQNGSKGSNRIVLMNDASALQNNRKLHLFPGTNQVVIAGVNNKTYKSYDSGQTFVYQPDFPYVTDLNIGVSFNNRYYAIGDPSISNGRRLLALSNDYGLTFRRDISVNWVPNGSYAPGYYVSTSRDGKYILFSGATYYIDSDLILSSNWGHDTSILFTSENYFILFVDPTGQNQMVGGIGSTTKYSNNYGQSWSVFGQSMTALGGVTVSADGIYKLVHESYESTGGAGCRVYISTDWSTWTTKTLSCQRLNSPSISEDGKYMIIPCSDKFASNQPYINVSRDYGQNWDRIDTGSTQYWSGSALSYDGKYMICIGGSSGGATNRCYKSIDYGYTWTMIEDIPAGAYQDVAMSKNGRYVYITGSAKGVFVSNDYMLSWTQQFDGSNAYGVFINY